MATITPPPVRPSNLQILKMEKMTWVYVEKPAVADVEFLSKSFNFHPLNLEDVLSRIQRPKIDEYQDHVFIVLHFPVYNQTTRMLTSSEVDMFVGEHFVVTNHFAGDLKPLSKFFEDCKSDEEIRRRYMGRSSGYLLYTIIDRLVDYCFPILNQMMGKVDDLEEIIFSRPLPDTVRQISYIRRDLISFRRIIHPQIAVIESLELEDYPFFKEEQGIYFGDVADHVRKIWDGLEDTKEVIDGLLDTSNWLTSHRIQEVMRVLTIVMGLMAPSTLLVSIFSMNIAFPGSVNEGSYLAFGVVIAVVVAMTAGMMVFLRKRGWL